MKLTYKRLFALTLALALALGLAACGGSPDASSEGDGLENTAAGSEDGELKVRKLDIVQEPDRLTYEEGETFDPTGAVVSAKLADGTTVENVPFEVIVDTPLTRKSTTVEFSYGGKKVKQTITVTLIGNRDEYSCANTPALSDSLLQGKTVFWLGSSVTAGAGSEDESMVDFLAKKHGVNCIKEAVSGTHLANRTETSYVSRFNNYLASDDRAEHLDAFVCQLSTNDKYFPDRFGAVTADDVKDVSALDPTTTFGAIEYIIATARETWDCPIFFYTNPPMGDENYGAMVEALEQIAAKWDVTIIDMYRDEAFNAITEEEFFLYMSDDIHPTRAGYRDWWLPKFEEALSGI